MRHSPSRDQRDKQRTSERDDQAGTPQADQKLPTQNTKTEGGGGISVAKIECYKCHEFGHYARDCPNANRMYTMHIESESGDQSDCEQDLVHDNTPENDADTIRNDAGEVNEPLAHGGNEPSDDDTYYAGAYESHRIMWGDCDSDDEQSEIDNEDRNGPYLAAMQTNRIEDHDDEKQTIAPYLHRIANRTEYPSDRSECLAAYIEIGGVQALTLFDTGSTFDTISPELAELCDAEIFELSKPMQIKLGAKNCTSNINYGMKARTKIGPVNTDWYFDVSDIAFYDAMVGIPFCSSQNVTIDVRNRVINVDGKQFKAVVRGQRTVRVAATNVKSKATPSSKHVLQSSHA
jgi:hypothetical protein